MRTLRRRIYLDLDKRVITNESNPEVMRICYANGWSKSPDYMTKYECSRVKSIGQAFRKNKVITSFDEFKYFVGVKNLLEAFLECTNLESITLPDSITEFSNTFVRCTKLKTVTLSKNLEQCYGFVGCSNLEYMYLPKKLKYFTSKNSGIEDNPFASCSKLIIEVDKDNPYLQMDNGILRSDTIIWGNIQSKDIATYTIPTGIKIIAGQAFFKSKLVNITCNEELETIGFRAFYQSTLLESVDLSNTKVKELSTECFISCSKLSNVILSNCLEKIGSSAFKSCSSLASIDFPESLLSIGGSAFIYTKLENVFIPKNVNIIIATNDFIYAGGSFDTIGTLQTITVDKENTNFYDIDGVLYCKSMTLSNGTTFTNRLQKIPQNYQGTAVTIPEGITSIAPKAAQYVKNVTSVILPTTLEKIGQESFDSASITSIDFSNTKVTTIAQSAFYNSKLTTCILNENTTELGGTAFLFVKLTTLQNTSNITKIGYNCLWGAKLTELNLPNCTNLEERNIQAMANLETVILGNVSSIKNCFTSCPKLYSIKLGATTAPNAEGNTFGTKSNQDTSNLQYIGTSATQTKKLLVPKGAIGYNEGRYLDPLQSTDKCNFIIEEYE